MTERDALLRAITENLYDDTPRLVFADWLDEHGEHDRAEFIRVQCELEPMRDKYEIPRAAELHEREEHFGSRWTRQSGPARAWLGEMPKDWDDWKAGISIEFRRGFPDILALPVRSFLELGARIRALHPTIRRVVLFRVNEYGERLAACDALEGLPELELACWYSYTDAQAIAASRHLTALRVLELWLAHHTPRHDAQLCRIMGAAHAWPNLLELTLLNPNNVKRAARKLLVKTADQAAGRKLAVYASGYPDTFPFAADFGYTFPGYLPNGRAAMAAEDHSTAPPTLCVIMFDKKGRQTKEVIRVPVPADVLRVPKDHWYKHQAQLRQQLIDVLGFRPGFIRIQDCHFPWDKHGAYSPGFHCTVWEELCGFPDDDRVDSWNDRETGNGGAVWKDLRNQEWVFRWDYWADKTGFVHST